MTSAVASNKRRLDQITNEIQNHLESYVTIGSFLLQVMEEKLFLVRYSTFNEYLGTELAMSYASARHMMRAAEVSIQLQDDKQPPPKNATQACLLAEIESPSLRTEVWKEVRRRTKGRKITGPLINDVKREMTEVTPDEKDEDLPVVKSSKKQPKAAADVPPGFTGPRGRTTTRDVKVSFENEVFDWAQAQTQRRGGSFSLYINDVLRDQMKAAKKK